MRHGDVNDRTQDHPVCTSWRYHSPHLLDLLHLLEDVDSNHSHHDLDGGQYSEDSHPDDLVVLEPAQQVVHARRLLHSPSRVLILLPSNKKTSTDL